MNLTLVEQLARAEHKTLLERMVKLQEEVGELAQELLIHHKASGSLHKEAGNDGILGECIDVTLVALSIFYKHGGTQEQLEQISNSKMLKWQKHQTK